MNIREIIDRMTLEEKVALCNGETTWTTRAMEKYGIPALFMCNGPSGLRKQEPGNGQDVMIVNDSRPATCFPAAVTTAATWDPQLLEKVGQAIGQQARDQKVGMVLGPGVNIKRNPLCGRNFEYFSEDPCLAGNLAAGFIRGLQGEGIACSLKHFACNSQERERFNSDGVIDERTLREIYLKAFEIAVRQASPATLMSSYPKINGIHCSDHKWLLNDVLREEWGFKGLVVTDWGGMDDRVAAMKAGNDLMMPGGSQYMEKDVIRAVREGRLDEEAVNRCAERIIALALRQAETLKEEYKADYDAHHQLAVRVAEEGAVLLKNEDGILPLKEDEDILIVGSMAQNVRYQGAGSSHVTPMQLHQPRQLLADYQYAEGCDERGDTDEEKLREVAKKAARARKVVVFAGLPGRYESEGFDRENMKMPEGHVRMIETAAQANPDTVVVLLCGSAVECPWADQVKAVLYMGLAGEATAEAVYNLLFGRANPSGRLAESWPYVYEDVISAPYYAKKRDALYLEGIYVGYRYYDRAGKKVRWPFGYGLSYTGFEYAGLKIDGKKVSLTLKNTGNRDGAETVQLYVHPLQQGVYRPLRELKAFRKEFLRAGESRIVEFELNDNDFAIWDDGWKVIGGDYLIEVGRSSADLPLTAEMSVRGETLKPTDSWYGNPQGQVSEAQWKEFFGISYQERKPVRGQFTMDESVMDMKDHSLVMKIMYRFIEAAVARRYGGKKDYENPEFRMSINSSTGAPLRSVEIFGQIKSGVMEGLLEMANGHFLKGIATMIRG
ncbi:MAG: glycoside hydrolase family 3 protein [Erysipelotrichaceae bacterium]|nr:glycoside hydrolase family 3 protein [Erysipelotrichaceae bacterium]